MVQISLIKSYVILLNDRVSAFTVCELLKENQQGGGVGSRSTHPPPPPTQIKLYKYHHIAQSVANISNIKYSILLM